MREHTPPLSMFMAGALVISTCLISPAGNTGATPPGEVQTREAQAAARKAWPAFFAEFRAAVGRRDRNALGKLMAKTFNAPPHTPEDAFRQWDDPKVRGWIKLRRVLALGAVPVGKPDEGDPEQERPTMISPPAADRGRYRGWFAAFEFQEDGKWYCIQFTSTRDFSP